jgi:hypothetical protein
MIDDTAKSLAAVGTTVLACLLAAGCSCLNPRALPTEPGIAPAAAVPATPAVIESSPEAQPLPPVAPDSDSPAAVPKAPAVPRAAPPRTVAAGQVMPQPVMPKAAATPVSPEQSLATLDFKALETRLRQTRAIGVLTKLSLKNQVDDLLARFRAYHQRRGGATLPELRRNYDMLLLKVLSLLQDTDPGLARDIVRSRAAMWSILEDPRKFDEFNRLAGAAP